MKKYSWQINLMQYFLNMFFVFILPVRKAELIFISLC